MLKIIMSTLMLLAFQSSLQAGTAPTLENTTKLYVATFNRAPDAGGLDYWATGAGLDLEGIAQSFFDQPETKEAYPANSSNTDFVEAVYQNLFNRASEQAGLDYWVGELDSGRIAKSTFILAVINGAQDTEEFGNDATILTNKTTVGLSFSNAGLNDVTSAKEIMLGVTANESTIAVALESYGIELIVSSDLEVFIVGSTIYGINTNGGLTERTFAADGTYTGNVDLGNGNAFDVTGTYSIEDNVLTFTRITPGAFTIVVTQQSKSEGRVDFSVTTSTGAGFDVSFFTSEAERDAFSNSDSSLEELIVGKTIYQKNSETIDSMFFQFNGELLMVDSGKEITISYRIEENILYTTDGNSERTNIFVGATADCIKFEGTDGNIKTFYFSAEDAQNATDCDLDDLIEITEAMLSGKTFYFSNTEDLGTDYKVWEFSNGTLTFGTVSWEDLNVKSTGTTPYSIEDGKILMENKPDVWLHIVLKNETSTTWEIRAQSITDATDGRDMVLYLSKPANYPAAL